MKQWPEAFRKAAERIRAIAADEKKRIDLLLVLGLTGLVLMGVSEWLPQQESVAQTTSAAENTAADGQQDYAANLETRLQALIEQVDGAGHTTVMVTLAAGEENVYATDRTDSADGDSTENHVLLGGSSEQGLVETVRTPSVLGVAVVCTGGGDLAVQRRVTELVTALTDVGANHITVAARAAE